MDSSTLKNCGNCVFFKQYDTGSQVSLGYCRKHGRTMNITDQSCPDGRSLLDFALLYYDKGLCVIPCEYGEKKPIVAWETYQKERPPREQIDAWFKNKQTNIAVVVGPVSNNLLVLDFEDPQYYYQFFPDREFESLTWIVKTGKGIHTYFISVEPIQNRKVFDESGKLVLEIRAQNQIVVMPPSLHPSKKHYEFKTKDFENVEIQIAEGLELKLAKKCWRHNLKGFESVKAERKTWFEEAEPTKKPYTGKDPACMEAIMEGVEEGWRNEACTRISSYLLNFKRVTEKKAWKTVQEWNKKNKPPLDEPELRRVFDSVLKGEYCYGCEDELLQRFCKREGCSLAKKDVFPVDIVEKAEEILRAPYLEAWTKDVYDETIVGEDKNKLVLHYLELSGRRKNPTEKQLIILRGEPGGGKTTLANETTKFYRTKKRGRFSERALDYSDLSSYDILYLQEILGLQKEEEGVSTIRFLSADDQGYSVEITTRDKETGRFTTAEYRIPPITVVATTTMVEIYQQLERRAWSINIDETKEQTEKVLDFKADREIQRFEQLIGLKEPSKNSEILRCMISRLEDGEVIVPFSHALKDVFEKEILRARGDYDKVLTAVKLRAWWHQKQRPYILHNETKIWFALPEDGKRALELAEEPLIGMLTDLEKRLRNMIPFIKELVKEIAIAVSEDEVYYGVTAKSLAQKIGKSQRTARRYLNELVNRGVLSIDTPRGRTNVYNFIIPEEQIEKKIGTSVVKGFTDTLFLKFKEETKSFLDRYRTIGHLRMGDKEIDENFLQQILSPIQPCPFDRYSSEQEASSVSKKESGVSAKQETTNALNQEGEA